MSGSAQPVSGLSTKLACSKPRNDGGVFELAPLRSYGRSTTLNLVLIPNTASSLYSRYCRPVDTQLSRIAWRMECAIWRLSPHRNIGRTHRPIWVLWPLGSAQFRRMSLAEHHIAMQCTQHTLSTTEISFLHNYTLRRTTTNKMKRIRRNMWFWLACLRCELTRATGPSRTLKIRRWVIKI